MKTSKISKEIPRKVEPQIKINRKKTSKEITNRIQEIEYVVMQKQECWLF